MSKTRLDGDANAPLSVTAVAQRLGISPSTIRTWERRYGLGPKGHRNGAHRRYQPEDVLRLSRMVEFIKSGVGASDAAALVMERYTRISNTDILEDQELTVQGLCTIVKGGEGRRIRESLQQIIAFRGLVRGWSEVIAPAMEDFLFASEGEQPGCAPSMVLTVNLLEILRDLADHLPNKDFPPAEEVAVLTDREHALAAHTTGVALRMEGVPTVIISTGPHGDVRGDVRFHDYSNAHGTSVAVVMGTGARSGDLMREMQQCCGVDIVLVGADCPPVRDMNLLRVRTLSACVDETIALAREKATAHSEG